jgi:hypothetical protein
MRTLAEDTDPAAERVLIELWRNATPAQKMSVVLSANQLARDLALTGLRERHPQDSSAQLRRRLADLLLGKELAAKAYGPIPQFWQNLSGTAKVGRSPIVNGVTSWGY